MTPILGWNNQICPKYCSWFLSLYFYYYNQAFCYYCMLFVLRLEEAYPPIFFLFSLFPPRRHGINRLTSSSCSRSPPLTPHRNHHGSPPPPLHPKPSKAVIAASKFLGPTTATPPLMPLQQLPRRPQSSAGFEVGSHHHYLPQQILLSVDRNKAGALPQTDQLPARVMQVERERIDNLLPHSSSSATLPSQFFSSSKRHHRARGDNSRGKTGAVGSSAGRAGGGGGGGTDVGGDADTESDSIESIYRRLSGSHITDSPAEHVSQFLLILGPSYYS